MVYEGWEVAHEGLCVDRLLGKGFSSLVMGCSSLGICYKSSTTRKVSRRLLPEAEWEENDEEQLPPDELPYGHPDRPQPPIDLSKIGRLRSLLSEMDNELCFVIIFRLSVKTGCKTS